MSFLYCNISLITNKKSILSYCNANIITAQLSIVITVYIHDLIDPISKKEFTWLACLLELLPSKMLVLKVTSLSYLLNYIIIVKLSLS